MGSIWGRLSTDTIYLFPVLGGTMREYIRFVAKFVCLCTVVSLFVLCVIMPQYNQGYCAAFRDKYDLEHKEGDEPRILLMGDSNVAFGFDSERIEEAFGMPVVNMGLHGGLGQSFCMDIAKSGIREGDVVVILPCHYAYSARGIDGTLGWTLLENDLTLWTEVNPQDYPALVKAFPSYLKHTLEHWVNKDGNLSVGIYARDRFNSYGDIITTRDNNVMGQGYLSEPAQLSVSEGLIDYYNEYSEYVTEQGAIMLAAGTPLINRPDRPTDEEYAEFYEKVKSELQSDFISNWQDYIYPMEYFFDTNEHLNDIGRVYRTEQLIKDLENWKTNSSNSFVFPTDFE